jgi:uracil phosphoribosyltransferase
MTAYSNPTVVNHPIVLDRLFHLREKQTTNVEFRRLTREITTFLTYEVTRDLETELRSVETPLKAFDAPLLRADNNIVIVSILRAGNGILESMLDLIPGARVGHIGIYRDHETLEAKEYFFKIPNRAEGADLIVVDPMLATANSAIAAISRLKAAKPRSIKLACILSAPEGIKALSAAHPDVKIFTAAVDSHLNEKGYIVPGLGDAGDRFYGTD